jgi:radical SAM protein with 4Fe4S-binding SPASM domain
MSVIGQLLRFPLAGPFIRENYAVWKRAYANAMRRTGLRPGPVIVSWVATNRCNSNCVYCEARANEESPDELTTAEIKAVLDELRALGTRRFFVIGGEPMVRRDLFEVLRYAASLGMRVGIFTNSLLARKFERQIRDAGLDNVWTSIDGLRETNNRYRGHPQAYELALDALRLYAEIRIPTRVVNTVVHPGNFQELPRLFGELRSAGMNWWRLGIVMPVGRARHNDFSLPAAQTEELFGFVEGLRRHFRVTISEEMGHLGRWEDRLRDSPFFCHAGLTFCAIMPDGHVVPCQTDHGSRFSEGNIRTQPFPAIWRDGFQGFRKLRLEARCRACDFRRACSGGCWIGRVGGAHCAKTLFHPPLSQVEAPR